MPQEKPLVLVVDDEERILMIARRSLLQSNMLPSVEVLTAGGVSEAKEAIKASMADGRSRITAVLTDWEMKDGNGAAVVQAAREAGIALVAAMTGRIKDNQEAIEGAGVSLILKKPFTPEELRAFIAELLKAQV